MSNTIYTCNFCGKKCGNNGALTNHVKACDRNYNNNKKDTK